MDSIPREAHLYVLIAALAVFFLLLALIRVILLRLAERKLLKANENLAAQLSVTKQDLATSRHESRAWREEMQRQFDAFRATADAHVSGERQRFDGLLHDSRQRETELRASLEAARQMCAELPAAKARILQLEAMTAPAPKPQAPKPQAAKPPADDPPSGEGGDGGAPVITPLPDLGGGGAPAPSGGNGAALPALASPATTSAPTVPRVPPAAPKPPPGPPPAPKLPPPAPAAAEMEQRLRHLEKRNHALRHELHLAKLRGRMKARSARVRKRGLCTAGSA